MIKIYEDNKEIILDKNESKAFQEMQEDMHKQYLDSQAKAASNEELKQSAIAKLSKLGLTEDEAKAIIGIQ